MKVARWGNSLAVRIPAHIVEALGLSEGDEIDLVMKDALTFVVDRSETPEELIRRFRGVLPRDFRFDRDEANER